MQRRVQRARRREVAAERLLDDRRARPRRAARPAPGARPPPGTCWAGSPGSAAGASRSPSSLAQPRERRGIVVVAVDVARAARPASANAVGVEPAVLGDAGPRALDELLARPARPRDADHRARRARPRRAMRLQRGEDLLVGEVAGGAEEHQRVASAGSAVAHFFSDVAAEAEAHRRQHLVLEVVLAARGEALEQRRRRARAPARPRRSRPATSSGPRPSRTRGRANSSSVGSPRKRRRGQVEQPGRDDAAAPPQLGDVGEVEVVLVVLGVAQRRRLGVVLVRAPCRRWRWRRMFRPSA